MATYTMTPRGDVVLCLTPAEARGLNVCAGEGAEGMLTPKLSEVSGYFDYQAQRDAASRAVSALGQVCSMLP